MQENKYNDNSFFAKYSQMERSRQGLEGAGEWQALKSLLPDFKGKTVLDLGCGYGWHCIYAAQQGASAVIGVDLSEKMLKVAKEKTLFPQVQYMQMAIEEVVFPHNKFDIILSSLALHYVASFANVVNKIHDFLKIGGIFIFSVEHPIFTAQGSQQWIYDTQGNILHYPVDNYYYEGKRNANFLGTEITKYHRTLTTYLDSLLQHGFHIKRVIEPMPPEDKLHLPEMINEMRWPMMLIISAEKYQ